MPCGYVTSWSQRAKVRMLAVSSRVRVAASVGLLALCAIAPGPAAAQGPNVRTIMQGYDGLILLDTLAVTHPIVGNREALFGALNAVFKELGIPTAEVNPATGMVNNVKAELSRRIGKVPLSTYFDCGRSFSGNNADFYRINVAALAWLEPHQGDVKTLKVAFMAMGRDPTAKRADYARCGSTGRLEELIATRVRTLVPSP